MTASLRHWLADWVPPHVRRVIRRLRGGGGSRYSGSYQSWSAACGDSAGYQSSAILEKVAASVEKVVRGEAAAERDSVLFDHVPYSFPLLAALLRAAALAGNRLRVLDVGGSLGSTYFQCCGFLGRLNELRWNVVEQRSFVECGRQRFQTDALRFFETIDDCLAQGPVDAVVLSSVLPYVVKPHALIDDIVSRGLGHILIDRTPVFDVAADRLTVQHVPAGIYGRPLSYPAWFLNRQALLAHFTGRYNLVVEFAALGGTIDVEGTPARELGFVFELRKAVSVQLSAVSKSSRQQENPQSSGSPVS